ncbi:MAG: VTC domain-containing protein [Pseudomonadota bacterium]
MSEHAPIAEIRSELKWRLDPSLRHPVMSYLQQQAFNSLYKTRTIFSLYYDYPDFRLFTAGEEGIVPRSKLRIRAYHDQAELLTSGQLEIKTTGESGRTKYSLSREQPASGQLPAYLVRMFRDYQSGVLRPVSLVRYQRRYFANAQGYRATVDTDIQYCRVLHFDDRRQVFATPVAEHGGVLELKTPVERAPLDFADALPLTRMRFSKYNESIIKTEAIGGLAFSRR